MKYLLQTTALILLIIASSCNSSDDDSTPEVPIIEPCEELELSFTVGDSIVNSISGGVPPYFYLWSTGETTKSILPAETGSFACTITDADGCSINYSVSVQVETEEEPCELDIEIIEEPAGTLTIQTSNASEDINYSWSTGETTQTIEVPHNGRYRGSVVDNVLGCEVKQEILVDLPGPCEGFIAEFPDNGSGNIINLNPRIEGGTPPYEIIRPSGPEFVIIEEYIDIEIRDSEGCQFTLGEKVSSDFLFCQPISFSISVSRQDNNITINPIDGVPPFNYTWNTGDTTADISLVEIEFYSVVVEDANGCLEVANFSL